MENETNEQIEHRLELDTRDIWKNIDDLLKPLHLFFACPNLCSPDVSGIKCIYCHKYKTVQEKDTLRQFQQYRNGYKKD